MRWVSCYQAPFQNTLVCVSKGDFLKYLTYGGGGWFPGELTKNRGLELSVSSLNFRGKRDRLEVEPITDVDNLINLACVMKKNLRGGVGRDSQWVSTWRCKEWHVGESMKPCAFSPYLIL